MLPEIKQLMRVQELETDIRKLDEETRECRASIEQIDKDTAKRAIILARMKAAAEAQATRRRSLEMDMKAQEERLARFRKQHSAVVTPKELEAVTHQIDQAQAEVSRLEEAILSVMDEEERSAKDLAEKAAAAARMDAKSHEQRQHLETMGREKLALIKGLREDRIVAYNALDANAKMDCDYLLRKYGPPIVVPVRKQACGGCGGILVPHVVIEAQTGDTIARCSHCQRYLLGVLG